MVNPSLGHKCCAGVSGSERFLFGLLDSFNLLVFGVGDLSRITGWRKSRVNNILSSLRGKGLVVRLKRGRYVRAGVLSEKSFEAATRLIQPSYISFWTALSFHGFTTQQVRAVQLVSTKQAAPIHHPLLQVESSTFIPERFYGYRRLSGFTIAEKEKALVDSLFMPEKAGGLDEVAYSLANAWSRIDANKFRDYLIRFRNKSLVSRVGYLLEKLRLTESAGKLWRHKSETYVKLNPAENKNGGLDGRWNIIVNHDITEEEIT